MHFKGFCLLRFDIQNITIKPSAGGCLFDAALTALKTLISQPSLLLLLLLYIAGSVAWRLCLAWGPGLPGAAMQRHPPAKCQRPPAGQKGNESGGKRCGNGVGTCSHCCLTIWAFGVPGCFPSLLLCGALSYGQEGGSCWAPRRILPGSSSRLCGSLPGATRCPSPLGWGQCLWSLAQRGWRGSSAAPGTDGDDSALMEGSPSTTRAWELPLGLAQQ